MTDTFNKPADQAGQGTTEFATAGNVDQNNTQVTDGENNLQLQVTGMEKRIADKDTHITTVESENLKLRQQMADAEEKLGKMTTIEDALTRMEDNQNANTQDTALDENALIERTLAALDTQKKTKTAEQNFDSVAAELTKQYGADAVDTKVKSIAEDNGLSFDDIVDLARKSPNAVYKMAGLNTVSTVGSSPSHSTSVGFNNNDEGSSAVDRQKAEFSKLRRENPKEYWKPETQKAFRKLFN